MFFNLSSRTIDKKLINLITLFKGLKIFKRIE